jgi:hypothetical protein
MMSEQGFVKVLKLGYRENLAEGYYEITFDRNYVKAYLREKILNPLGVPAKDALKVVAEAFKEQL